MLKRYLSLLLASLVAASAIPLPPSNGTNVLRARGGDCSSGPWNDPVYVGGYHPNTAIEFCETEFPNLPYPINTITIFSNGQAVNGFQFGYADPSGAVSQVYGDGSAPAQSITIDYGAGERITTAALFTGPNPQYLRGMTIQTNQGQQVHGGVTVDSGIPYQLVDVGQGFLLGAAGDYEAAIIENVGLLFLNSPVASISVTNIQLTAGPAGVQGISPMTVAGQHFYNGDATESQGWDFDGSKAVTSTSTLTQMSTDTYGGTTAIAFMASGSFFFSIGVTDTTTFSWMQASGTTTTTTSTVTDTLSWSQSGTLLPHEGTTCTAVSGHGSGSFPYTSTVTITLQNGYQFPFFGEPGSLYIDSISSTAVSCTPDNVPGK